MDEIIVNTRVCDATSHPAHSDSGTVVAVTGPEENRRYHVRWDHVGYYYGQPPEERSYWEISLLKEGY